MPNGKPQAKPQGELLRFRAGELTLSIAPWICGAVTGFEWNGRALLRPTPDQAVLDAQVRRTSAFALVPFSNRIADGRFSYEGMTGELSAFPSDQQHAIHGIGWQVPWRMIEVSETGCLLELSHDAQGEGPAGPSGWPYAFRATQRFSLSETGLRVQLTLENYDERRMPAGFGWHPFFPLHADTSLSFSASHVWMADDTYLPTDRIAAQGAWDFTQPRTIAGTQINHCFVDWDGQARIALGKDMPVLGIQADPVFSATVVFVPENGGFFAFEPVSHMPDAINRQDARPSEKMAYLEPGDSIEGTISLTVTPPSGNLVEHG